MPKSRPPYPAEFRQPILELVRAGRTPKALEKQFEPRAQTIRNWIQQAARDNGKRPAGLTRAERQELSRRRRANRPLQLERARLAKAAAWFARETGATTSRPTAPPRSLARAW